MGYHSVSLFTYETPDRMTNPHVDISRRFSSLSEEHLIDPDYLSFFAGHEAGMQWEEINISPCTVILGEGKCGKTYEFKKQHQLLKLKKQFSFFIPLELLQDHELYDVITSEEELEFERWRNSSPEEAVFFLDAVDELKLREGSLRKAFRIIVKVIGNALLRAKFYISCRPNDWDKELDFPALSTLIAPEEQHQQTVQPLSGEQIFTDIVSRNTSCNTEQVSDTENSSERIQILTLLPFTRQETLEFAKLHASNQVEVFSSYLEKNELWHLYRLPYEIISALDQLSVEGKLGNLEEQLRFGINHKIREASDKKRNSLTEERALEGAERLALALFMTKRRSILSDNYIDKINAVTIGEILTDWTFLERKELLGKSLFDPTGIGLFRFHHRSTQEYLAAKRIKKLREAGLGTRDLFGLLFAKIKDERVVIPSMEPIAAWLALWYPDIYSEVKIRTPSLMFRQGIPTLLPIEYRKELIRTYVEKFASSNKWCGVGIGHSELKRISTPELAPVVHELWQQAYIGFDTRELLLELIYLTPLHECVDLALEALFDTELPCEHRIYAAWSVLDLGNLEQKQLVSNAVVQGDWPEKLVRNTLPNLLPEAISETEFVKLALSLKEIPNNVHGLGFELFRTIKSEDISSEQRIYLRNSFAKAIWDNRSKDCRVYQSNSKYDHFVDAVVYSCFAMIPSKHENVKQWA